MLMRVKVAAYRFKGRQNALCVSRRFEASHAPLSDSSRPVRILRSIVQTLVLSMFDAWNQRFLSGPIASEFVSDDDPGGKASELQQFAEELLRGLLIAMTLHQDIEDLTRCIHGSPQVIWLPFDGDHNLVQIPLVSRLETTATNLMGIRLSKLFAPLADGFIRFSMSR
jgi:hypothetical protein